MYLELQKTITQSRYVIGDETPIRVLDPARPGAARQAWLWVFHAPELRSVVFDFPLTRSHEPALAFLRHFAGVFQTDGYAGYLKALRTLPEKQRAQITHLNCLAHCRRPFVEALAAGDERAAPFLAYLGALYRIEAELREASPADRALARGTRSTAWLVPLHLAIRGGPRVQTGDEEGNGRARSRVGSLPRSRTDGNPSGTGRIVGGTTAGLGPGSQDQSAKLAGQKSAPDKVRLAAAMKQSTSVPNGWLASRLAMGQPASVSQFVRRYLLVEDGQAATRTLLSRVRET